MTRADGKKLSLFRLSIFLFILLILVPGVVFGNRYMQRQQSEVKKDPWFASYVDVTATPLFELEQMGAEDRTKNAVLSFIVASNNDGCSPSWGGAYSLKDAGKSLDLDRRIELLKKNGGNITVSFGGLINDELALVCSDENKLKRAYSDVISKYDLNTIDLDLEGQGLTNLEAAERRAMVLSEIQNERRSSGDNLAIWVTLPITPLGLTEDGTNAVAKLLGQGVDIAGVNAMTMNYGQSKEKDMTMSDASIQALKELHRQMKAIYSNNNIYLNDATIWGKIGATPMLGQNDISEEVFTLEDAEKLNIFAREKSITRISMWSANRDRPCGGNYSDTTIVSDSCSGVDVNPGEYSDRLSRSITGQISSNAGLVTTQDEINPEDLTDDPATSPYQVWSEDGAYLEGTKVVWHKNVYEAKWWTRGDLPDDPVLQSWETPWKLIGPVLPGEKPIEQPTLPTGTYPKWSGDMKYDKGQRVLFDGTPYEAKWWTRGDSPAAASSNADSSPWVPLTQKQIEEELAKL